MKFEKIVELLYENRSVKIVSRRLHLFHIIHNRLSESSIGRIIKQFKGPFRYEIKIEYTREYWFVS